MSFSPATVKSCMDILNGLVSPKATVSDHKILSNGKVHFWLDYKSKTEHLVVNEYYIPNSFTYQLELDSFEMRLDATKFSIKRRVDYHPNAKPHYYHHDYAHVHDTLLGDKIVFVMGPSPKKGAGNNSKYSFTYLGEGLDPETLITGKIDLYKHLMKPSLSQISLERLIKKIS